MTLTPPQIEVLLKLPADGSDYAPTTHDMNDWQAWRQVLTAELASVRYHIERRRFVANITPSGIEALKEIDNG